jgi:capsular exopolysaccharide synthesis family protein
MTPATPQYGSEGMNGQAPKDGRMASPEGALEYVVRIVRRRWIVFVVALLAVPLVAFLVSSSKEKLYTADATLLFQSGNTSNVDPEREAATNEALASLPVVAVRAAEEMGGGTTAGEVLGAVSAESSNSLADVTTISATSSDPDRAAEIANGYSEAFIEFRKETDQAQVQQAISLVERSLEKLTPEELAGDQGGRLEDRLNRLKVQRALQTGRAELVQPASVPDSPSSPKTKRNVLLGILLGALLGFGLAALLERVDRRVRSVDELEGLFGAPLIARISRNKALPKTELKDILQPEESEDFRVLRTNLRYFNIDRELKSVLLASPEPGDGKSTVARGLAAAMAEVGEEVMLLEGDLRKESEFRSPGGRAAPGLSTVLSGVPLDEVLIEVPISTPGMDEPRALTVLPSGPVPPNPSELLESERMQAVMEELHERFKVVVIDSPALGIVSDALDLAPFASEVLVIGGVGKTTQDAARAFVKQLALLGKKPVGVIATFTDVDAKRYSYYQRSGMAARR